MEEKTARRKGRILRVAVVLALLLLGCTLVSRGVYAALLPVVQTVKAAPATLAEWIEVPAKLMAADPLPQRALGSWVVNEVFVGQGDMVAEGEALFTVDLTEHRARAMEMDASIRQQQNDLNRMAPYAEEADLIPMRRRLDAEWLRYNTLLAEIPADGTVRAESGGTLAEFALQPGTTLEKRQAYVMIQPAETSYGLQWDLSAAAHGAYGQVEQATVAVVSPESAESVGIAVSTRRENGDGSWRYSASWPGGEPPAAGSRFTVHMTRSEGYYPLVLPLACVQSGASGGSFVYVLERREGLFSEEYVVQTLPVDVLFKDGLNAAVLPVDGDEMALKNVQVVYHTSKPLQPGMAVSPGQGA